MTAQTVRWNLTTSAAVHQQAVAATAAGAATPASPQSVSAVLSAADAAAPATAAGHDDDARNCSQQSRRCHCHRHELTAFDPTFDLSVTAHRQTHHWSLLQNRSLHQQVEHASG